MLRSLFITTLLCVSSLCLAQGRVGYTYDACGNRISRTIVLNTRETRAAAKQDDISLSDSFSGHRITLRPVSSDGTSPYNNPRTGRDYGHAGNPLSGQKNSGAEYLIPLCCPFSDFLLLCKNREKIDSLIKIMYLCIV